MALQAVTSRGLVLFDRPYREKDRLVKIFTEQAGKRMFLVKNSGQSRLHSAIQPLALANYLCKINSTGLSYLDDYRDLEPMHEVSQDIFKLAHATYAMDLADHAIDDGEVDPALFAFLTQILQLMNQGIDEAVLLLIYETQLLARFGALLDFSQCVYCHRSHQRFDFSFKYSGVLCPKHYDKDDKRLHVDPNVLYLLAGFQEISLERLQGISLSPETKQKLREFMDAIYENYIGIHLKSKKFLDGLSNWGEIMR